jgi:SAM-dependent methyltransferase
LSIKTLRSENDKNPDYGWKGGGPVCSHEYLIPVIDKVIKGYRDRHAPAKKLRIFDAGCGNGFLVGHLLASGFETAGCDVSVSGVARAREAYPQAHVKVLSVCDDMVAVFGREWDVVVSSEVIEHLYNPQTFVQRVGDMLKPGGLFIVTTPYHGYLKNLVLAVTGLLDRHFTVLWIGGHIKFWSYRTLKILLLDHGFLDPQFYGAGRLPFLWKSMVVTVRKPG